MSTSDAAPTEQEAPSPTELPVRAVRALNVLDDVLMTAGQKLSRADIAWIRRILKRWERRLDKL